LDEKNVTCKHLFSWNKEIERAFTLISPVSVPQKMMSLAARMLVILLPADILPNFFGVPLNHIWFGKLISDKEVIFMSFV